MAGLQFGMVPAAILGATGLMLRKEHPILGTALAIWGGIWLANDVLESLAPAQPTPTPPSLVDPSAPPPPLPGVTPIPPPGVITPSGVDPFNAPGLPPQAQ